MKLIKDKIAEEEVEWSIAMQECRREFMQEDEPIQNAIDREAFERNFERDQLLLHDQ